MFWPFSPASTFIETNKRPDNTINMCEFEMGQVFNCLRIDIYGIYLCKGRIIEISQRGVHNKLYKTISSPIRWKLNVSVICNPIRGWAMLVAQFLLQLCMSYGHFSEIAWVRIKPRRLQNCNKLPEKNKRNPRRASLACPPLRFGRRAGRQGFIKTNKWNIMQFVVPPPKKRKYWAERFLCFQ